MTVSRPRIDTGLFEMARPIYGKIDYWYSVRSAPEI